MYFPSTGKSGIANRPDLMTYTPFMFRYRVGDTDPAFYLYGWDHPSLEPWRTPYPFSITVTFMTQCQLAPSTYAPVATTTSD